MTNIPNAKHWKKLGKQSSTFYFKQFKVEDGNSTMKVGTDAVLLGVVAEVQDVRKILEIGTGCGVISLVLAQRSQAQIDTIEIDEGSVAEARSNVENSPWKDRIHIIHSSLQDYIQQSDEKYNLVISNPPYFSRSLKSPDKKRNLSRHDDSLSFAELLEGSSKLMLPDASLWVILPAKEGHKFIELAGNYGLSAHYQLNIAHKTESNFLRVIIQLKKTFSDKLHVHSIAIRDVNDSFTQEYIDLTEDFYLDF